MVSASSSTSSCPISDAQQTATKPIPVQNSTKSTVPRPQPLVPPKGSTDFVATRSPRSSGNSSDSNDTASSQYAETIIHQVLEELITTIETGNNDAGLFPLDCSLSAPNIKLGE